ncbi:acetyltransferase [Leucothrix arctica]|uniref:Acetyltransferase n=2 Tax=Leucothrix arctica TaxID=1481894 RepID=A0A317CKL6_9GAMM|nr:acetyltransferase [Leucothrix arctica]
MLEFHKNKITLKGAKIGELSVISRRCIFQGKLSRLKVGRETFIGESNLMLHGHVDIGDFTVINDGVKIITASHDIDSKTWSQISKNTTIGDNVWIATDATILPGVIIHSNAIIGAGAVVSKNVGFGEVVVGNPAKLVKKRKNEVFCYSPVRFIAPFEAWIGLD